MKIRKEYLILGAVIVALVAFWLRQDRDKTHFRLPQITTMYSEQVTRIEITRSGGTFLLDKKDGNWLVGSDAYAADVQKVNAMLEALEDLTLTDLISESKNYLRYDLSEDRAIRIRAWAGDTLPRNFHIGKTANTYRHTFVKLPDDPAVYQAKGYFRNAFDQDVAALRDKTVLSFKADDIKVLEIKTGDKTLDIRKTEKSPAENNEGDAPSPPSPKWKTHTGRPIEDTLIDQLLYIVSDLKCNAFLDQKNKADLKDPMYTFIFKGKEEFTLLLFAESTDDATRHIGVTSQQASPFILSNDLVEELKAKTEDLLASQI